MTNLPLKLLLQDYFHHPNICVLSVPNKAVISLDTGCIRWIGNVGVLPVWIGTGVSCIERIEVDGIVMQKLIWKGDITIHGTEGVNNGFVRSDKYSNIE